MIERTEADTPQNAGAEEGRRLRAGLLRLKSALHDPVTGLYSYHVRVDELRARIQGDPLGVHVLDFPALGALEATLRQCGVRAPPGVGVDAALSVYRTAETKPA